MALELIYVAGMHAYEPLQKQGLDPSKNSAKEETTSILELQYVATYRSKIGRSRRILKPSFSVVSRALVLSTVDSPLSSPPSYPSNSPPRTMHIFRRILRVKRN